MWVISYLTFYIIFYLEIELSGLKIIRISKLHFVEHNAKTGKIGFSSLSNLINLLSIFLLLLFNVFFNLWKKIYSSHRNLF